MVCVQIAWVKAFDFLTKKEGMFQLYHIWPGERCAFPHFIDFCILYDEKLHFHQQLIDRRHLFGTVDHLMLAFESGITPVIFEKLFKSLHVHSIKNLHTPYMDVFLFT